MTRRDDGQWLLHDAPVHGLQDCVGRRLRLHRLSDNCYGYAAPRFAYHAELEVSEAGFVRRYPGLWELED